MWLTVLNHSTKGQITLSGETCTKSSFKSLKVDGRWLASKDEYGTFN